MRTPDCAVVRPARLQSIDKCPGENCQILYYSISILTFSLKKRENR